MDKQLGSTFNNNGTTNQVQQGANGMKIYASGSNINSNVSPSNPYKVNIPTTTNTNGTIIPALPNNVNNGTSPVNPTPNPVVSTTDIKTTPQNLQTAQPQNQVTNPNEMIGSLNTFIGNTAGQPTQAEQNQQSLLSSLGTAQQQEGTKGQAQLGLESQLGVPQYMQQIQDLNTSIASMKGQYLQAEQNALHSGGTTSYGQGAFDLAQNAAAIALGTQAALLAAYQGNLTTAQNYASHVIDLQYQPIENQIASIKDQLSANKDIMTASQTDRAESLSAALAIQGQAVDQAKQDKQNQFTIATQAAQSGASTQVTQSIANAPSLGEALRIYSTVYNGQNPNLPTDVIDKANGVLTGQDGKKYDLTSYATDPQQLKNITATTSVIQNKVGTITDANTAQKAIDAVNPKSSITGAQVMAAAQQYGVDPAMIIGVMNAETQMGTDKSKGSQMNNFGNVGNTDSAMANGTPTKYKTSQEGIDALAENLAGRTTTTNKQTPSGLADYNNLVASAPANIRSLIHHEDSTGVSYMDYSDTTQAANWAKNHGIEMLPRGVSATDVANITNAIQAVNDAQEKFIATNPPEGATEKFFSGVTNKAGSVLGTTAGNAIKDYTSDSFVTSFLKAINTIIGDARLTKNTSTIGSSDLPFVPSTLLGGFAGNADSKEQGITQFNSLRTKLNTVLHNILPNAPTIPQTSSDGTTGFSVTDPNGAVHTFKDQASLDAFKKAAKL
jgi:hypothetical protein